jgi:hypothetical protein
MKKIFLLVGILLLINGCSSKPDLSQYTKVPFPDLYCEMKFTKVMVLNRRKTNKENFARICAKDIGKPCSPILLEAVEKVANADVLNSHLSSILSYRDVWCAASF